MINKDPIDKRIIKKIFNSTKGKNFHRRALQSNISEIKMRLNDHMIRFNPHDPIGARIYTYGSHTRKSIDYAINLLKQKDKLLNNHNCVELGGNIGTHTIYMHLHNIFKKIYVVEPEKTNFDLLTRNIFENNLENKTSLINAAISLKSTKLKLYIDKNNSGAHSLVVKQNKNSFQVVDALSPNLLFKKYNIKNVGFIFLDIEGLEIDIILELLQIVDKNIPIYFEFIPEFSSRSKVQKFFKIIADRYNNLIFFKETKSDFFTKSYTNFNELFNLKFKQCDLLIY
tara:strand:+ start:517 stop:1368 length:852 start_codon:yes stop_codon:yes gene_type:complete